jgi:hypothetical protein
MQCYEPSITAQVVRKLLTAIVVFGTIIPNRPLIITLFGCFQCSDFQIKDNLLYMNLWHVTLLILLYWVREVWWFCVTGDNLNKWGPLHTSYSTPEWKPMLQCGVISQFKSFYFVERTRDIISTCGSASLHRFFLWEKLTGLIKITLCQKLLS